MIKRKKQGERAAVNQLIKHLKQNSPGVYVHVDRDSGSLRHTSSGWDFMAVYEGRAVFCECKMEKGPLTDWQKLTRVEISRAQGRYLVLRFFGDTVEKEGGAWRVNVANVNASWLFEG